MPPYTVSKPKPAPHPTLWPNIHDRDCNMAASRHFCGDFFEEATAKLFYGARLLTDSQYDICPDIMFPKPCHESPTRYGEVKCIGNNGSAIIYTHRREKDLDFIQRNRCVLEYFFWRHHACVKDCHFLSQLRQQLAETATDLVRLPAPVLHAYLADKPTRVLNTGTKTPSGDRLGYGTNGYGKGWSIPYTTLQELAMDDSASRHQLDDFAGTKIRVYGYQIAPINTYLRR